MIPVTVRLANAYADRHITKQLGNLSYRSVDPGGFASASFDLDSPIDVGNPLLAPFTRVHVYDSRSGEVLWEGRLQLPGKSAADRGELWDLTAIGPSGHAQDLPQPLIYIDRDFARWIRLQGSAAGSTTGPGADPAGSAVDVMVHQFPAGQPITTGSYAGAAYWNLPEAGMQLGACGITYDAGKTDTNYLTQLFTGTEAAPVSNSAGNATFSTTSGSMAAAVVDDFPASQTVVGIRIRRDAGGATTVADDNTWATFTAVRVLGRRMLADGTLVSGIAGMQSTIHVNPHQVVGDLLGRMLPQYDGANALVESSTYAIDQLAYPDGVTAAQVLEDVLKLVPEFTWGAWESNSAGKYRFEWRARRTQVRYEATVDDGFTSPAPSFEQYDSVRVRWRDPAGRYKSTVRTQTVPEMTAAGVSRRGIHDLADEVGSLANAQKAGDEFLAEHRYPPSAGTLTLARPLVDLLASRRVDPWQVRPGELIRVRGIEGSSSALNASERDGQTVFRIVSVEASGDGTAQLELDVYTPTEERAIAELSRRHNRKR